jgi:hypothetical protein
VSNKASVLVQFCTYFPIYSVECRTCVIGVSLHAPMLEISRALIGSSLVTLYSRMVRVFCVELLSPARIWFG